jgi:hypothetical protein
MLKLTLTLFLNSMHPTKEPQHDSADKDLVYDSNHHLWQQLVTAKTTLLSTMNAY